MSSSEAITAKRRPAAAAFGLAVLLLALSFLCAWLLGSDFARVVADRMKANTSLGLTLCGAALVLRGVRRFERAGDALASIAALIGLLTGLEYLGGVNLGIDELLQREHSALQEAAAHPNRMAPNAALGLVLCGAALILITRAPVLARAAQAFAALVFLIGFTAGVGYLYSAPLLYQPTDYIRMSPYTAAAMVALSLGVFSVRTDLGLSRVLAADDAGGWVLRRALPAVLGLPVLFGWVRIQLQHLGHVDMVAGTALLVVSLTIVCATLAVFLARSVARADLRRRDSELSLESQAKLTAALSRATTVDEVARVVVSEGSIAIGAAGAGLLLPTEAGDELEFRSAAGYPENATTPYRRVRIDAPLAFAEAWRTAEPVLVHDRAQFSRRYSSVPREHVHHEAWASLPLLGRDRVLGVLALSFAEPRRFEGIELERLTVLAWHCAQAVERALLLDSERNLRSAAERTMAELRAAQEAAVAANQTKDEFLAMLGHELRNPLAPIAIALDMLDRKKDPSLLRERRLISRQLKHMMRMVDDLLDVSRIARGKIQLSRTRVELKTVVNRAVEVAAPLLEQKRHNLVIDVPERGLPLWGDEHRLTQVVSNLLTNAARYTDDDGHIELRAALQGERVVLTVKDDGDGIAAEQLPRLFEAFVQAPTEQRSSAGGLGLGLALVKKFTELHGGTARAESGGLGQGSTFTVELPLAPQQQPEGPAPAAARRASVSEGKRVLVVDDNVDAAEMLAEGLRAEGHDVRVANDGPRALDMAAGHKPDVAFLDLGMPAMNGYEIAARLRELDQRVVLVAVTGYGQPADFARTTAAGFQHHLVKPVDLETTLGIARDPRAQPASQLHVAAS